MHPAEGEVAGRPDFGAGAVGGKDRPPDVVGADVVDSATFDHRHHLTVHPDIIADELRYLHGSVLAVFYGPIAANPGSLISIPAFRRAITRRHLNAATFGQVPKCHHHG